MVVGSADRIVGRSKPGALLDIVSIRDKAPVFDAVTKGANAVQNTGSRAMQGTYLACWDGILPCLKLCGSIVRCSTEGAWFF